MLAEKWRKELREKFEIEASLADFGDLKTATERLEREGAFHTFCLIATYTGVKSSREDAHRLDSQDDEIVNELGAKATWLRRLRRWEQTHAPFDLVIFDEAQHMRNPDTAAFRLGESLALNAGAVLCVSATPLATSNEDLRTLLRLVDPSFFGNASVFNEMLEENRPAVRAGNALAGSRPNLAIAKTAVRELQRSRYLGGTALLKQAEEALQNLDLRDRRSLAEAQDIVERLNILGTYVTRTRRIQVEEMRAVRDPKIIRVEYSPQERALYDAILSFVRNRAAEGGRLFHFFEVIGWQLRAASCLPAVAARIQNTEDNDESIWVESFGDWAEPEENGSQKELPAPSGWNEFLKFDFAANDTKFAMLLKILNGELRNEKCVIFSYYRPTLAYLERRLSAENIGCLVIHGGVPQDERGPIVDKFASEAQVKVLLSSEVGSEGIDLQFCSVVVNYDLPWNPMRIEQRIGRIDRVGQKAERLRIFHFKIKDTVEERIFEKLHMRLELFRNSLGDLDAVLGEEIEKLTRELFSQKLTAKQEEYRIEQTALVIERRHREMEELESRGEGLVAMADYLQQKIRGSRGLGRYVTAEELEESLRDFFSRNTGAELRWDDPAPECFRIKLRPDMQSDLASFLGGDQSIAAQRLRAREFCVCFRSETVKSLAQHLRRQVLFINHLSPLIRWITKRNEQKSDLFQRVSAAKLLTDDYAVGLWIYLARRWSFNGGLSSHRMAYAAIGPSDQLVEGDSAETLVVRVLREGIEWEYPAYDQGAIFAKYLRCTSALDEEKGAASLKFAAENESYIQVRRQRTITYFERRIRSAEQAVATARDRSTAPHRIRGLETILRNERESRDSRLAEIERNADPSSEETDVAAGLICIESPS
jgi:superfamily II DNA or RNA helicase